GVGGSVVGRCVFRSAPESAQTNRVRSGRDGFPNPRPPGRTFLSRLLRSLLLFATLHFLRQSSVGSAAAAIQQRWICRRAGGSATDRRTDSPELAQSPDHPAGRFRLLPG